MDLNQRIRPMAGRQPLISTESTVAPCKTPLSKSRTDLTCWDTWGSVRAAHPQRAVGFLLCVVDGFSPSPYRAGATFASAIVRFPALHFRGQKWYVTISGDAPAAGEVHVAHQLARHAAVVLRVNVAVEVSSARGLFALWCFPWTIPPTRCAALACSCRSHASAVRIAESPGRRGHLPQSSHLVADMPCFYGLHWSSRSFKAFWGVHRPTHVSCRYHGHVKLSSALELKASSVSALDGPSRPAFRSCFPVHKGA